MWKGRFVVCWGRSFSKWQIKLVARCLFSQKATGAPLSMRSPRDAARKFGGDFEQFFCEKCQSADVFEGLLFDKKFIECVDCKQISHYDFC